MKSIIYYYDHINIVPSQVKIVSFFTLQLSLPTPPPNRYKTTLSIMFHMVNSVRIIWCSLFPQLLRPLMDIPPLLGLQLPAAVWTGGGGFPGSTAWFLAETFLSHHLRCLLSLPPAHIPLATCFPDSGSSFLAYPLVLVEHILP